MGAGYMDTGYREVNDAHDLASHHPDLHGLQQTGKSYDLFLSILSPIPRVWTAQGNTSFGPLDFFPSHLWLTRLLDKHGR